MALDFFPFGIAKKTYQIRQFLKKKNFCTQLCTLPLRHNGTICSKHQKSQNAKKQCELRLLS